MNQGNVLLYSPGLGYINRGGETFTRKLHKVLTQKQDLQVTLFQGAGKLIEGATKVWAPRRNARFYDCRLFSGFKPKSYWIESLIFSLPLALHCYSQPCDIIHFNESVPANVLYHLRRRFGGRFRLLLCNGAPLLPMHYKRYDYVQTLTPTYYQEALESGYPKENLFLVTHGLDCQLFAKQLDSQTIALKRQAWNLPTDRSLILSVGAVNTGHKRMDWLVTEFSKLDPKKFFLWIVGQPEAETQTVKDLAAAMLKPGSYTFDVVPYARMPEVYAIADYFAMCSLKEGFGLVYIEAMAAGLPTIAHRTLNTEWILGMDNRGLINMGRPDTLRDQVLYFEAHPQERRQQASWNQVHAREKFDWSSLYDQYLWMYQQMLAKPASSR